MNILDLIVKLIKMHGKHGNLPIKIDCYNIEQIEYINAIPGEHGAFIDLQSELK